MSKHTILFLAANPLGSTPLKLNSECAAIQRELKMVRHREDFRFESRWAVGIDELMRHLRELDPTVIHFSSHGSGSMGLVLEDEQGASQMLSGRALTRIVGATAKRTRLIVLNACYSVVQAAALRTAVDCIVGMDGAIGDAAARRFAVQFYGALGDRRSVGNAVENGIAVLAAYDLPDEVLPRCVTRNGLDAHAIFLDADQCSASNAARPLVARTYCTIVLRATLQEFDTELVARLRDLLREVTGDVLLEIVEVREGSVRITVLLSVDAGALLVSLRESGRLDSVGRFEVLSVHLHAAATVHVEPPRRGLVYAAQGTRVLIVDDNVTNLKLMAYLMRVNGYTVETALDAETALDSIRVTRPDVILLDIQLPGIDGLELIRRLKADPGTRDIVIIVVTAHGMKGDQAKALAAGCDDFITKPIDTRKLPETIARHLAARGTV